MSNPLSTSDRAKTILLVEDNPNDEALTLRSFEKANIANRVDVVRDGEEALDYLFAAGAHSGRDPTDLPTIVLLDLKLPKLDGLDVLQRLRADERTALLPVVVLTSSDEERDLVESYRLGTNSYVRKPVKFADFAEVIRQVGLYWLLLNEAPPRVGKTS